MGSKSDIAASINKKKPDGLKASGKPYKVLVVDDSAVMRSMVSQILKSEQYEICGQAADGVEAIELFKKLKPDVMTLDINMPKKTGIETLKEILKVHPEAKIVMLTSEGQKSTVVEAIALGAKNYIVKPPDRKNVLDKVGATIGVKK